MSDLVTSELCITEADRERIREILAWAARPENWWDPIGKYGMRNPGTRVEGLHQPPDAITLGTHSCVFSYTVLGDFEAEPAPIPAGVWRHITIKLTNTTSMPHPSLVNMILPEFGMTPVPFGQSMTADLIVQTSLRENYLMIAQREPGLAAPAVTTTTSG